MASETFIDIPKKAERQADFSSLAKELTVQAQPGLQPHFTPAAAPNSAVDRHILADTDALMARLHPEQLPICQRSRADKADALRIEDTPAVNQFARVFKQRQAMLTQLAQNYDPHCAAQLPLHAVISGQATFVQIGPFTVKPEVGSEAPIGRAHQALPFTSISRLAGYVGRDQYGLYVREVPDMPQHGLRPSKCGVWVKQAGEQSYRRLAPGQAVRVNQESTVRIGGDGVHGEFGLEILVR